ncbi:MAG: primosomal protein N', partial [Candidatus Promineifilaceae bacterium]
MYAELVINIEAPLSSTFHYFVPRDLERQLHVGQLVEVEFGRRLAQGIIVAFSETSPVPETKPIVALIEREPVVQHWQIELAYALSAYYLAPLNASVRLMLPPGLTRWADVTVDLNPYNLDLPDLSDRQAELVALLREKGALRGRQLSRLFGKKKEWQVVVDQLVRKNVLRRGSVLDPPRARPKEVRMIELSAGYEKQLAQAGALGVSSKQSDLLLYVANSKDPLPDESLVLRESGASEKQLAALLEEGLLWRAPETSLLVASVDKDSVPVEFASYLEDLPASRDSFSGPTAVLLAQGLVRVESQPASIGLNLPRQEVLRHALLLRRGQTYFEVLDLLAREGQPLSLTEVYARTGASLKHLKRLAALDLVKLRSEEMWRDPLADRDFVVSSAPQLTEDQSKIWNELRETMDAGGTAQQPVLLHGVTGSGKTEIYMRAVQRVLQQGRQAIILVPEIALTPQTVRRFASRFPGRVALVHSRLSDGERYDTWRRAREGLFDIVIGPRSALFTPFSDVGLIVIDEEHDASYKHSAPVPPPYYHAREAAIEIGRITGATVILGSATPDVVTYHRALSGHIRLLELPKRVMGHRKRLQSQAERLHTLSRYEHLSGAPDDALTIPLPPVQVVDLRQELRAGNRSIFSRALAEAVSAALERHEQVILFLNRRGTASFIICRDCGHVLRCPRCDLPLTYHRPNLMLICHQCGYREAPRETCPHCGSKRIRHFGLGTEEVEARVQQQWPEARITRWDRDTTAGKDSHEALLASFVNHES